MAVRRNVPAPPRVLRSVMDFLDPSAEGGLADDEVTVRPGPWWRHALWVVGVAALGVGMGWAGSLFRLGPDDYGLLAAAPGSPWTYLAVWAATALAVTTVLRVAAAKVPVPSPGTIAVILLLVGTRLSLGRRPETPELAAMAAAALVLAGAWAGIALRAAGVARKAQRQTAQQRKAASSGGS